MFQFLLGVLLLTSNFLGVSRAIAEMGAGSGRGAMTMPIRDRARWAALTVQSSKRSKPLLSRAAAFLLFLSAAVFSSAVQASGVANQTGDVLAGVGAGKIKHFRSDGMLLDTLDTGGNTFDTGMAFDAAGNLYATTFNGQGVVKFDNKGNPLQAFGGGYNRDPESIVFDKMGNAYVGQADGLHQVLKFSSTGLLRDTYSPQTEDRGTDWIDLAADQCTLFYTSEGVKIKRFDICTKTQLADFAILPAGPAYALRIRPNGDVLVAATTHAYLLNSSGIIKTYTVLGAGNLFALNLDPDNKTFWTGDISNGTVARIDIAAVPTKIITQFNAGALNLLAGLTVVGEITAATSAPPFTTSYYVHTMETTTTPWKQQLSNKPVVS